MKTFRIIIAILIAELAGIIGTFFTTPAIPTWYATLLKPELAPPNWIFGPVWTTLFALMGIASYLIWEKGWHRKDVKIALSFYAFQLALNTLWSAVFFGLQNPGLALVEISLLWISILATILAFYKISRPASYLLIPYILWVSFAMYLNYAIWTLN